MMVEPQKFFVGVIDFFAILLPGALLTFLLQADLGPALLGREYRALADARAWAAFLFCAYFLGHFVFLVGAWLLDEKVFDPIRLATDAEHVRRLASGGGMSSKLARGFARQFIPEKTSNALSQALRIKDECLRFPAVSSSINAFQWSKAKLTLQHPEALAAVQRYEADSKFFRSLFIVLCILSVWGVIQGRLAVSAVGVALLPLSFWRYVEQRVKSINQAYWFIIVLEGEGGGAKLEKTEPEISHAGGVVFRHGLQAPEYLLVRATKAPTEWVLPKGHIEIGEKPTETAVREVHEETGVWARVVDTLKSVQYVTADELVSVQYYLMESLEAGEPREARAHAWFPFADAIREATHAEAKDLLRAAEKLRPGRRAST